MHSIVRESRCFVKCISSAQNVHLPYLYACIRTGFGISINAQPPNHGRDFALTIASWVIAKRARRARGFIAALDRDLQLLVLEEALSASSKDILSGILPCSITLVAALDRDL
jgi:hypothetical protein